MIIGLTGKNGAGKGEAANFLQSLGFHYYSLSDVVREEVASRGLPVTRDNLVVVANELRSNFGANILAKRILQKLEPAKNYAIDSIRNPAEVEALREREDFTLLAITANPKVRFERMKVRARENDPTTYEGFLAAEAREAESTDPNRQQLNRTEAMADISVPNDGLIAELHLGLRGVLAELGCKKENL